MSSLDLPSCNYLHPPTRRMPMRRASSEGARRENGKEPSFDDSRREQFLHPDDNREWSAPRCRSFDFTAPLSPPDELQPRSNSAVTVARSSFNRLTAPTAQAPLERKHSAPPRASAREQQQVRRAHTPSPTGMHRYSSDDHYYYYDQFDPRDEAASAHFSRSSCRPILATKIHYPDDQDAYHIPLSPRSEPQPLRRQSSATCPWDEPKRRQNNPRRRRLPAPPLNAMAQPRPPQPRNEPVKPRGSICRQLPVPDIHIVPETPLSPPPCRAPSAVLPPTPIGASASASSASTENAATWRSRRALLAGPDFSAGIRQSSIDSMDRNSPPGCITPPPATLSVRVSSPGYQPARHAGGAANRESHRNCRRRPSLQSQKNYVETECTCPTNEVIESSSTENLESKSSDASDVEPELETPSPTPQESIYKVETDSGLSESILEVKSPVEAEENPESEPISPSNADHAKDLFGQKPEIDPFLDTDIGMGILKFTVQYFPLRKRLRIQLRKAEDLATGLLTGKQLNPFLKVWLMPGKIQKQVTRTIRNHRSPIFNEEFFFDNITSEETGEKILIIGACHEGASTMNKSKEEDFGRVELALGTLNGLLTKKEIHCTRSFKSRTDFKKLGKLQVYVCLEKEAKRLTVNVIKADNLPRFPLVGAPDPYVKISVDQNGPVQAKQTRTLKSTCSPCWKEAVMFLVETSATLLDKTSLVISVHDHQRARACTDIIGEVHLGCGASTKTEQDQWKSVTSHSGKEVKATHHLRPHREQQVLPSM